MTNSAKVRLSIASILMSALFLNACGMSSSSDETDLTSANDVCESSFEEEKTLVEKIKAKNSFVYSDRQAVSFTSFDMNGNYISSNSRFIEDSGLESYCTLVHIEFDQFLEDNSLDPHLITDVTLNLGGDLDQGSIFDAYDFNSGLYLGGFNFDTIGVSLPIFGLAMGNGSLDVLFLPLVVSGTGLGFDLGYTNFSYKWKVDEEKIFDMSIPATTKDKLPVIVTVHGGDWYASGYDRTYFSQYTSYLNSLGFIHVNMDYKLIEGELSEYDPEDHQPNCNAMLADINNVIGSLVNGYSSIVDTSKITLWGYSAGAQLVSLYAYGAFQPSFGDISYYEYVNCVLNEAAPTYFSYDHLMSLDDDYKRWFSVLFSYMVGKGVDLTEYTFAEESDENRFFVDNYLRCICPLEYVPNSPDSLRSILSYSEGDEVVPYSNHTALTERLDEGNKNYYDVSVPSFISHDSYSFLMYTHAYDSILISLCS